MITGTGLVDTREDGEKGADEDEAGGIVVKDKERVGASKKEAKKNK